MPHTQGTWGTASNGFTQGFPHRLSASPALTAVVCYLSPTLQRLHLLQLQFMVGIILYLFWVYNRGVRQPYALEIVPPDISSTHLAVHCFPTTAELPRPREGR